MLAQWTKARDGLLDPWSTSTQIGAAFTLWPSLALFAALWNFDFSTLTILIFYYIRVHDPSGDSPFWTVAPFGRRPGRQDHENGAIDHVTQIRPADEHKILSRFINSRSIIFVKK